MERKGHGGERALRNVGALNPGPSQPKPTGKPNPAKPSMWLKPRTKAKSVKSWCDPRPIPECPGGPRQPLGGCRAGGLCHTPGAFPQDRGAVPHSPHSWGIPTLLWQDRGVVPRSRGIPTLLGPAGSAQDTPEGGKQGGRKGWPSLCWGRDVRPGPAPVGPWSRGSLSQALGVS